MLHPELKLQYKIKFSVILKTAFLFWVKSYSPIREYGLRKEKRKKKNQV